MLLPQLWQTTCGYFWRLTCPNLVGLARYRLGCDACVRFPKRPLLHHFCTNVEKLTVSHFCKQFTKTQILAFTEFTGTVRSYLAATGQQVDAKVPKHVGRSGYARLLGGA